MKITTALCFCVSLFYGSLCAASDLLVKENIGGSWLTDVNGTLFFRGRLGLWKSDGTNEGTVLVKDTSSVSRIWPDYLTNVDGTLYFIASSTSPRITELWTSDGTEAGTQLLKEFNDYIYIPNRYLTHSNGTLFMRGSDANHGRELWKSDGTVDSTVLVKDIVPGIPGPRDSQPSDLTDVNGTLFFSAFDVFNSRELWKSDGTEEGTIRVQDVDPPTPSMNLPDNLINVDGTLYFTARYFASGNELWKSDGTEAGTILVKDIYPGINSSDPSNLTDVNGTLFFTASDDGIGIQLWKSDGTQAGTVLVKNLPESNGVNPQNLTDVNGTLFFSAFDSENGNELWKSDGTDAGTVLVKDIYPGEESSLVTYESLLGSYTNVKGTLFFSAKDRPGGPSDARLWMSDGTEAGTMLVEDVFPEAEGLEHLTYNFDSVNVNGRLFFITRKDLVFGLYALPVISFTDVSPVLFGFKFIETFFVAGITGGCTPGNYCPSDGVTRAQMAVFLEKATRGADFTPPPAIGMFNDVPASNPFAPWIEQLAADGITGGCGANSYCPNASVSRAQMGVFIEKALRGSSFTPPDATGMFADVPITDPFAPWVEQLANDNITGGCGGGNYCPNNPVTRAQMAVFMVKAFDLRPVL